MIQRLASTAFVVGMLVTAAIPVAGLAQSRGHSSSSRGSAGSSRGRSFAGGGSNYAPRGGQSYSSPRGYAGQGGYAAGPRYYGGGYAAPRSYGRPVYRGSYGGGLYLGYGSAYGYPYGYAYGPGYYYGPAAVPQACAGGVYDQYGNWIPNPNCYSAQPVYPPVRQNYSPYAPQGYGR